MQAKLQPKTIGQLFEVLTEFRSNYSYLKNITDAYQKAIQQVSSRYKVTYQTIGDLCRRRLGLRDIVEFQNLLRAWVNGDYRPLCETIIKCCYVSDHDKVTAFFQNEPSSVTTSDKQELTNEVEFKLKLDSALVNKIEILAKFEGITVNSFVTEILTAEIETKTRELLKKLV